MAEYIKLNPTADILVNPHIDHIDYTPGEIIPVYQDPLFQLQVEGDATLVKKLASTEQRELWLVTLTAGITVRRWIKKAAAV